eukprot:6201650-Pleurochrysis_carterae.AAC.1
MQHLAITADKLARSENCTMLCWEQAPLAPLRWLRGTCLTLTEGVHERWQVGSPWRPPRPPLLACLEWPSHLTDDLLELPHPAMGYIHNNRRRAPAGIGSQCVECVRKGPAISAYMRRPAYEAL